MKRYLFISVFAFAACTDEIPLRAPQRLIPSEKIIPIIVDLQVLESHYHRLYSIPAIYKDALDSSSNLIFQKYDVTKSDFDSSFSYYASDANVIYAIYEAALDSINFRANKGGF